MIHKKGARLIEITLPYVISTICVMRNNNSGGQTHKQIQAMENENGCTKIHNLFTHNRTIHYCFLPFLNGLFFILRNF